MEFDDDHTIIDGATPSRRADDADTARHNTEPGILIALHEPSGGSGELPVNDQWLAGMRTGCSSTSEDWRRALVDELVARGAKTEQAERFALIVRARATKK